MIRLLLNLVLICSCNSLVFALTTDWQLSPIGLGPLKIGMTLQEAQKVTHTDLSKSKPDISMGEDASCFTTQFKNKKFSGFSLMISNGKIVRINILSPQYPTDKNIRIGDDEKKVLQAYPTIVKEMHKYDSEGHYFTAYEPPTNAIRFETNGKKVTLIYSGKKKEVGYVEDCL